MALPPPFIIQVLVWGGGSVPQSFGRTTEQGSGHAFRLQKRISKSLLKSISLSLFIKLLKNILFS